MQQVDFGDSACNPPAPFSDNKPGGSGSGEPHYITFDGLLYDLQTAGDFILADTTDGEFAAHVRIEPWTSATSVQTAIGLRFNDVIINYDNRTNAWTFTHRGQTIDPSQAFLTPIDGVLVAKLGGNEFVVLKPNVASVRIGRHGYLNIDIDLLSGQTSRGLLGNNDQNPNNDLIVPEGATQRDWIHGPYTDELRLMENSPLLPYTEGKSARDYAVEGHPVFAGPISAEAMANAKQACEAKRLEFPWLVICIHDVALTGDVRFAEGLAKPARPDVQVGLPGEASLLGDISLDISSNDSTEAETEAETETNAETETKIETGAQTTLGSYSEIAVVDFRSWAAIGLAGAVNESWEVPATGRAASVDANLRYPIALMSEQIEGNVKFTTALSIDAAGVSGNKDHIGFLLGADIQAEGDGQLVDFILVDWKHSDGTYGGQDAPEGWRIARYQGYLPATLAKDDMISAFWSQSNDALITEIAHVSADLPGWTYDTNHIIEIEYSSERILVKDNGRIALDARGVFPNRGQIGLYNYSQPNVTFSDAELAQ
ncbi:MAG: VWD domain-containing protein [Pseudomonadota bacterium]